MTFFSDLDKQHPTLITDKARRMFKISVVLHRELKDRAFLTLVVPKRVRAHGKTVTVELVRNQPWTGNRNRNNTRGERGNYSRIREDERRVMLTRLAICVPVCLSWRCSPLESTRDWQNEIRPLTGHHDKPYCWLVPVRF